MIYLIHALISAPTLSDLSLIQTEYKQDFCACQVGSKVTLQGYCYVDIRITSARILVQMGSNRGIESNLPPGFSKVCKLGEGSDSVVWAVIHEGTGEVLR